MWLNAISKSDYKDNSFEGRARNDIIVCISYPSRNQDLYEGEKGAANATPFLKE